MEKEKIKMNKYIPKLKNTTVDNFTTNIGIKLRKIFNPVIRNVAKLSSKNKVYCETTTKLPKNKQYVFVSTHSFSDDIFAALVSIKRNAYVLIGSNEQLEHNPEMYGAFINGLIAVDLSNEESKKASIPKMLRIFKSGSSVLVFPEGSWNITENVLITKLFRGFYTVAKEANVEVVPIASHKETDSNKIYVKIGEPIDVSTLDEKEAINVTRDALATHKYELLEKHGKTLKREELSANPRDEWMMEKRREVLEMNWTRDEWEYEYNFFKDKEIASQAEIWGPIANLKINPNMAYLAPTIKNVRSIIKDEEKYDYIKFLKATWQLGKDWEGNKKLVKKI